MTLLPGHLRSCEVTWHHLLSRDCHLLRVTALWELKHTQNLTYRPSTATSRWLPVKWRLFRVTSGHCTFCKLQPCGSINLHKTRIYNLLKPLWGNFRWYDVTSGHFRPLPVTWHHFLSRVCHLLRVPALEELKVTQKPSFRPCTATSRWVLVKWRYFRVTSGHVRSHDVISCHVTATPCSYSPVKAQTYRKSQFSAFYRYQVISGKMTSLPGHFRSSDVTWRNFLSQDCPSCELQPCRTKLHKTPVFNLLLPLLGDFQWNDVTSGSLSVVEVMWVLSSHVTATSCESQPCRSSNLHKNSFRPSTGTSQWLPVKWRHFWSCEVMRHHFLSHHCHLPASCSSAGAQSYTKPSFQPSTATSRWLPVKWQHPGDFCPCEVMWHHFMPRDCHLLRVTAL